MKVDIEFKINTIITVDDDISERNLWIEIFDSVEKKFSKHIFDEQGNGKKFINIKKDGRRQ